jgi:DedD protein
VLVALAVIFIPMLLPGKGDLSGSIEGSNIPPEPDYRFPPIKPAPSAPAMAEAPIAPLGEKTPGDSKDTTAGKDAENKKSLKSSAKAAEAAKTAKVIKTSKAPAAKKVPVKTKSSKVSGWIVQVGSFSNRKNAKGLRDKLRKLGHTSFVEAIKAGSGTVYRVRVGPELTLKSAEKLKQRLAKEAQLTGLVQEYP